MLQPSDRIASPTNSSSDNSGNNGLQLCNSCLLPTHKTCWMYTCVTTQQYAVSPASLRRSAFERLASTGPHPLAVCTVQRQSSKQRDHTPDHGRLSATCVKASTDRRLASTHLRYQLAVGAGQRFLNGVHTATLEQVLPHRKYSKCCMLHALRQLRRGLRCKAGGSQKWHHGQHAVVCPWAAVL